MRYKYDVPKYNRNNRNVGTCPNSDMSNGVDVKHTLHT